MTCRVKEGSPFVPDPPSLPQPWQPQPWLKQNLPLRVRSNISLLRWRGAHLPQGAISNEVIIDRIFLYVPSSFSSKRTTKVSRLSSQCGKFRSFTYRGREECGLLVWEDSHVMDRAVEYSFLGKMTELPLWKLFTPFFHVVLIKKETRLWGLRVGHRYFALFAVLCLSVSCLRTGITFPV